MGRPKTIILVCNTSWGIYKFRIYLIRQLIKRGYAVYVLAPEDRYTEYLRDENGLNFIALKHFSPTSFSPLGDWKLYRELCTRYKEIAPDLIFHYTIKSNIYGSLAAAKTNSPSISVITGLGYTFLNTTWLRKLVTAMYRHALRHVQEVWLLNADDLQYFADNHIVPAKKTCILPGEGVDEKTFAPAQNYEIKPNLIFLLIGRIIKEKGIAEYAEAAKMLRQKGYAVECQLVGFYDYKNPGSISARKFFSWVSSGAITYLGATDDIKPLIEKADCVVLPSYREGLPISLLEAGSMEKPLIAADTAGCREVVLNGRNGFLCPAKYAKGLARSMEEFYHLSPADRFKMGQEARKIVLSNFTQEKVVSHYINKIAAHSKGKTARPKEPKEKLSQ